MIGGEENSKITLQVGERKSEMLPAYSNLILDIHKPNRIRITITNGNRIFLFINGELRHDLKVPFTPMLKYISFATSNNSLAEYYFNCTNKSIEPYSVFSGKFTIIDGVLILALIISFSINIITLFIIFIAWSTS